MLEIINKILKKNKKFVERAGESNDSKMLDHISKYEG